MSLNGWRWRATQWAVQSIMRTGSSIFPVLRRKDAAFQHYNPVTFGLNNILGSIVTMKGLGGLAGSVASTLKMSDAAAATISRVFPTALQGGASSAARGDNVGKVIINTVISGALGYVSFDKLSFAAEKVVGKALGNLLAATPGIVKAVFPALANVTTGAVADTGLNMLADLAMGREVDMNQVWTNLGTNFAFAIFSRGKNGNSYIDPITGKNIDVPEGRR